MLIGLCGFATSGKSATADILTEIAGFEQHGFADALREMALAIDPVIDHYDGQTIHYAEYLREHGYKRAKQHPEVRRFLQRLGTDAVRSVFSANAWVDVLHRQIGPWLHMGKRIVLSDVRFLNEAEYVTRDHGKHGKLWRIERPGVGPANNHASELSHLHFDVDRVLRANDLQELRIIVERVWEETNR